MKKELIIGIVIGVLLAGSIGAYAAIKLSSSEISYKDTTVEQTLNSLYISRTNNDYSTDEKVIGKWIDGKTLYQKVFKFDFTTYTPDFSGDLNLGDYETICRAEVYHSYNDGKSIESSRYGTSDYYLGWYINNNKVVVANKITNISKYSLIVIVEYTKTTD